MNVRSDQDDSREPNEEADMARIRRATVLLMDHFDSVQIFATRYVDTERGTVTASYGDGNWYARRGQVGDWIKKANAEAANGE